MKKKHLPLEKDVDIEFEYKIYMLLDYLKKYYKPLIALGVIILTTIIGYFYWEKKKEELYNQASAVIFDIGELFAQKKYEEAQKLINRFKERFADTPYVKLALAYEVLIKKENKESPDKIETTVKQLKNKLSTKHLKSASTEFEGYLSYVKSNYENTIKITDNIKKEHFNYISASLLKAFAYKKLGKEDKAKGIFEEISETSPYQYFKLVARENL